MKSFLACCYAAFFITVSLPASAGDTASKLQGMVGWTIAAVTQVEDEFEGCDFDKVIKFTSGIALTCSSYGYSYAFMPSAVIFTKSGKYEGRNFHNVKVLIDDDFYDMQPVLE
ncbi:hypothetical protein D3C81_1926660 [compost metagenome]